MTEKLPHMAWPTDAARCVPDRACPNRADCARFATELPEDAHLVVTIDASVAWFDNGLACPMFMATAQAMAS